MPGSLTMRAVTVLCNAASTSCISARGAIASTPFSSTRASRRVPRAAVDGTQALADDDRLAPPDAPHDAFERARGQHAIGVHEHDERAHAVVAQIGDGFGIGQRQGNAIAGLPSARKELVHQDEPHTDAGHDLLEAGALLHEGRVGRFRHDRQLEIAMLDEIGDVAVAAQGRETKAEPSLDVGGAPNGRDHPDAGLGDGIQHDPSCDARCATGALFGSRVVSDPSLRHKPRAITVPMNLDRRQHGNILQHRSGVHAVDREHRCIARAFVVIDIGVLGGESPRWQFLGDHLVVMASTPSRR